MPSELSRLLGEAESWYHTRDDRESVDFSLAIFDLDNTIKLNDIFGHQIVDLYLESVFRYIKDQYKEENCDSFVFRSGGDECSALVFYKDKKWARERAEKVRLGFMNRDFISASDSAKELEDIKDVTLTGGICSIMTHGELPYLKELFSIARYELESAKLDGRNRIRQKYLDFSE